MSKLVKFGEAIEALKSGNTIYRQCWEGTKIMYVPATPYMNAIIIAHLWNGTSSPWTPTHDDMLTDDWIIEYKI